MQKLATSVHESSSVSVFVDMQKQEVIEPLLLHHSLQVCFQPSHCTKALLTNGIHRGKNENKLQENKNFTKLQLDHRKRNLTDMNTLGKSTLAQDRVKCAQGHNLRKINMTKGQTCFFQERSVCQIPSPRDLTDLGNQTSTGQAMNGLVPRPKFFVYLTRRKDRCAKNLGLASTAEVLVHMRMNYLVMEE